MGLNKSIKFCPDSSYSSLKKYLSRGPRPLFLPTGLNLRTHLGKKILKIIKVRRSELKIEFYSHYDGEKVTRKDYTSPLKLVLNLLLFLLLANLGLPIRHFKGQHPLQSVVASLQHEQG